MNQENTYAPPPRLSTVKNMAQLPQYKKAFTEASLRALIFNSSPRTSSKGEIPSNGLDKEGAIVRVGRKVLINLDAFDAWLMKQNNVNGAQQ